jgi:16S rRNA processing protein RimM
MSESNALRILLGRIVDAHGIRGEVIVHSFADAPEDVAAYGPLSNQAGNRTFKLKVLRVTPKGVIARIDGVADRNAAEALRGTDLYVARDKLPAASADEYYHADLIGLAAVAPDGTAIGRVVNVQNFGAGDLIEIELAGTKRTEFLPFSDAFVPEVDIANGRIVVLMPDGRDEPPPPEADKS